MGRSKTCDLWCRAPSRWSGCNLLLSVCSHDPRPESSVFHHLKNISSIEGLTLKSRIIHTPVKVFCTVTNLTFTVLFCCVIYIFFYQVFSDESADFSWPARFWTVAFWLVRSSDATPQPYNLSLTLMWLQFAGQTGSWRTDPPSFCASSWQSISCSSSSVTRTAPSSVKVQTSTSTISRRLLPSTLQRRTRGSCRRSRSWWQNSSKFSQDRSSRVFSRSILRFLRAIAAGPDSWREAQ